MNISVVDGLGGGMGRLLVEKIRKELPDAEVFAAGTNTAATQAMLKAGAHHAATGENAVIKAAREADIITGPAGIAVADAVWGEISPAMAQAVGKSRAWRVLVPMNMCRTFFAGTENVPPAQLIDSAVRRIKELCSGRTDGS